MSIQSVLGKRPASLAEGQPPAKVPRTNGTSTPENGHALAAFDQAVRSQLVDKQEIAPFQQKVEKLETQVEVLSKTVEEMKGIMERFIKNQMGTLSKMGEEWQGLQKPMDMLPPKKDKPTQAQQSGTTPAAAPQTINLTTSPSQEQPKKMDELTLHQDIPTRNQQPETERALSLIEGLQGITNGLTKTIDKAVQRQVKPTQTQQANATPAAPPPPFSLTNLTLPEKIKLGYERFQQGKFRESILYLHLANLAETHPLYGEVQYKLGISYCEIKDLKNARTHLSRISGSSQYSGAANFALGKIHLEFKIYTPDTINYFLKVPLNHSFYDRAQAGLGDTLVGQNKYSEAIEYYEKVLPTYINFASVQVRIAKAYLSLKNSSKAMEYTTKARELLKQTQAAKLDPQHVQEVLTWCEKIENQLPSQ